MVNKVKNKNNNKIEFFLKKKRSNFFKKLYILIKYLFRDNKNNFFIF